MTTPHCENCGAENPEMIHGEAYTECCNELCCEGGYEARFGIEGDFVRACCWTVADHKFAAQGRTAPRGSSRLFD